uniref:Uncharacterized protein n=1 Tax=Bionectria ochroleuca TaxID=29856 RepID=A0A8H7NDJ7_BIOOC
MMGLVGHSATSPRLAVWGPRNLAMAPGDPPTPMHPAIHLDLPVSAIMAVGDVAEGPRQTRAKRKVARESSLSLGPSSVLSVLRRSGLSMIGNGMKNLFICLLSGGCALHMVHEL